MILDMAMGGSTNTVLHMLAIAHEAGVDYDIERINELSRRTPNICKVAPEQPLPRRGRATTRAASTRSWAASIAAGPALLNLDCPTVTGKTLGENIAEYDIRAKTVSQEALELAAVTAGGTPQRRRHERAAARGHRSAIYPPKNSASIPTTASARSTTPTARRAG